MVRYDRARAVRYRAVRFCAVRDGPVRFGSVHVFFVSRCVFIWGSRGRGEERGGEGGGGEGGRRGGVKFLRFSAPPCEWQRWWRR